MSIESVDRVLIAVLLTLQGLLAARKALPPLFRAYLIAAFALSIGWLIAPNPTDGAKWGVPVTAFFVGASQSIIAVEAAYRLSSKLPPIARHRQLAAALWFATLISIGVSLGNPQPYASYLRMAFYARLYGACFGFGCVMSAFLICLFDRDPRPPREFGHAATLSIYLAGIFIADRGQWEQNRVLVNMLLQFVLIGCMSAWISLYHRDEARESRS